MPSAAWEQIVYRNLWLCVLLNWPGIQSLCLSQPTFMVVFVAECFDAAHAAASVLLLHVLHQCLQQQTQDF